MGYGVFRKHPSFSKTQASKNVDLNVSKNCDALFYLMTPFWLLYGSCGPQCTKS